MSWYTKTVRNASLECISCNAPVIETTDGSLVCVDCGASLIRNRKPRKQRLTRGGIELTKHLVEWDQPPRLKYSLNSTLEEPAVVHLRDSVPITGGQEPDGTESTGGLSDDAVDVRLCVPPEGETTFVYRLEDSDRASVFSQEPEIVVEHGRSTKTEQSAVRGDGSRGPTVRSDAPPDRVRAIDEESRTTAEEIDGTDSVSRSSTLMAAMPAYNEANTIATVVEEATEYADTVLVVDDGSDDDTSDRAENAGASLIKHTRNKGYGAALKTIFEEAHQRGVTRLVVLDSDGQHDVSDIPRLVEKQRSSGAEIVIGSRFSAEAETQLPQYRRIGLAVINVLTNLSMGVVFSQSRIRDTQSGFRLYDRTAIESLANDSQIGNRMEASLDVLYHAHQHDYRFAEVGTTINYDVENANNQNPVLHGYQLVRNILRTIERERPILSLGFPGFLITSGGLTFITLKLHQYLQTGTFPVEQAFVSAFAILIGIFACFTAIILHSLEQLPQRQSEEGRAH